MTIKPIKTEREYHKALKEIEKLWSPKPNTPKGNRLDVLVTLVEAYEQKYCEINPADPIEATKFRMEQLGLKPSDLAKILGGRSRVSKVLNKKMLVDLGEDAERQFVGRIVSKDHFALFPHEVLCRSASSNFIPKVRDTQRR